MRRFKPRGVRISPALIVSMIALFVALSSTGVAADIVPLAKRALTADKAKVATKANNALKLNNLTATQIAAMPGPATDAATLNGQTAAQIAAIPGPASAIPGAAFRIVSRGWSVQNEDDKTTERALCASNEKVVGGGWDQANGVAYVLKDQPLPDLSGWMVLMFAESGNDVPANGSIWAICMRTS